MDATKTSNIKAMVVNGAMLVVCIVIGVVVANAVMNRMETRSAKSVTTPSVPPTTPAAPDATA